jgi:hypothetical protein
MTSKNQQDQQDDLHSRLDNLSGDAAGRLKRPRFDAASF